MDNFSQKKFLQLKNIIKEKNKKKLSKFIEQETYQDLHNILSYLSHEERFDFFHCSPIKTSATLLETIADQQEICKILIKLERQTAANFLKYFASDNQVDILRLISSDISEQILNYFSKKTRGIITSASCFEDDTAGGLMVTEFLKYNISLTANDIKKDLEKNAEHYKKFDVQYTYVINKQKKLVGIIPIRNLILATKKTALSQIIRKEIISIRVDTPIEQITNYFEKHSFLAFPVVDQEEKILGIITKSSVEHFLQKETAQDALKFTGIMGGEEYRSQPIYQRSLKRLSWLSINIVLNFIAASVIIAYEGTLMQVITLAVFLPIISDMSGCSGNQSVAVTLREIALGLANHQKLIQVLLREFFLGCINGIILGGLLALIAFFWKGNIYLGLVVGLALALNTIMAVCLGSTIPIILKTFKMDPAIASSPILTTVTDMSGFFLLFLFASQVLPYLS